VPQRLDPLLQFEMTQVLLYNVRHRHSQRRRKILRGHRALLFNVIQQPKQTISKTLRVPRGIELNR